MTCPRPLVTPSGYRRLSSWELLELRRDMTAASTWMQTELTRQRAAQALPAVKSASI